MSVLGKETLESWSAEGRWNWSGNEWSGAADEEWTGDALVGHSESERGGLHMGAWQEVLDGTAKIGRNMFMLADNTGLDIRHRLLEDLGAFPQTQFEFR